MFEVSLKGLDTQDFENLKKIPESERLNWNHWLIKIKDTVGRKQAFNARFRAVYGDGSKIRDAVIAQNKAIETKQSQSQAVARDVVYIHKTEESNRMKELATVGGIALVGGLLLGKMKKKRRKK